MHRSAHAPAVWSLLSYILIPAHFPRRLLPDPWFLHLLPHHFPCVNQAVYDCVFPVHFLLYLPQSVLTRNQIFPVLLVYPDFSTPVCMLPAEHLLLPLHPSHILKPDNIYYFLLYHKEIQIPSNLHYMLFQPPVYMSFSFPSFFLISHVFFL